MGILICGLNGSGKSTLGKQLADRLGYEFIDNEDLYFPKTDENYAFSGGLHGVGASVVNALSEWLKVEVYRDGHIYEQEYRSYEEDGKEYVGHPMYPLRETGDTKKHSCCC